MDMAQEPMTWYGDGQPVDNVRIAQPCPASWKSMPGDDVVRHCSKCNRNVYNISEMGRDQANELIRRTEGRLCGRRYLRSDGTVMTKDGGWVVESAWRVRTTMVAAIGLLGIIWTPTATAADPEWSMKRAQQRLAMVQEQLKTEKDPKKRDELEDE